ncbi:EamA family transporter RarD [Schaalia sp. Marseille-Q2122]|uniref:EamA family transporter RarD n=1 Tax=Schaalia sp. Marseille-Q2122 TaxID=2736604 RepID=UPI0020CA3ED7|nr:EamA family transporter RarD [Schaalia sp. Marseille-Q2122]
MSTPSQSQASSQAFGLAILAHVIWGFFPLYFRELDPAHPLEVIVHRAVWGLVACVIALMLLRRVGGLMSVLRNYDLMWRLTAAGLLIIANWTTYVYAVQIGRTVDAALGYFINPLVTVALGVIFLGERIRPLQWAAVSLGALAVVVLLIGVGSLPWISLVLAFSFSFYSLVKKKVALKVGPLEGMAAETAAMTPILLLFYAYLVATGMTSFHVLTGQGATPASIAAHAALLAGAGVLTVIPLMLFAKSSQHLPLGVLGLIQYLSPSLQFMLGVWVFREQMEPIRWVATGIVWCALVLVTTDWFVQARKLRRLQEHSA